MRAPPSPAYRRPHSVTPHPHRCARATGTGGSPRQEWGVLGEIPRPQPSRSCFGACPSGWRTSPRRARIASAKSSAKWSDIQAGTWRRGCSCRSSRRGRLQARGGSPPLFRHVEGRRVRLSIQECGAGAPLCNVRMLTARPWPRAGCSRLDRGLGCGQVQPPLPLHTERVQPRVQVHHWRGVRDQEHPYRGQGR